MSISAKQVRDEEIYIEVAIGPSYYIFYRNGLKLAFKGTEIIRDRINTSNWTVYDAYGHSVTVRGASFIGQVKEKSVRLSQL